MVSTEPCAGRRRSCAMATWCQAPGRRESGTACIAGRAAWPACTTSTLFARNAAAVDWPSVLVIWYSAKPAPPRERCALPSSASGAQSQQQTE
eukprot:6190553-Pleurochrysis_carterae.AAC.1